jgi:ParB family chromosome partitioning protein
MNTKPQMKRGTLGKGITSLLGDFDTTPETASKEQRDQNQPQRVGGVAGSPAVVAGKSEAKGAVVDLLLDCIVVNPNQPRRFFKEDELASLAASIKVDGVIQPVMVTRTATPGKYTLIAGERRLRASKLAGMTKIPAIIRDPMNDQEQLRVALIENIQRQDLNVVEEAEAYHALIHDFGLTQEQCADKVGKERSTVANILRISQLPREVQDDLVEGRLTMGHGRALLALEDKKQILRARDIVIKRALNVRQTEQFCKSQKELGSDGEAPKNSKRTLPDLDYLADGLRSALKTKVKLVGDGNKGRIEIAYFSATELERLMAAMGHKIG